MLQTTTNLRMIANTVPNEKVNVLIQEVEDPQEDGDDDGADAPMVEPPIR